LFLPPEEAADNSKVAEAVRTELAADTQSFSGIRIIKRSIDARSRQPKIRLLVNAYLNEPLPAGHPERIRFDYPKVHDKRINILINHGADENILIDAHPHIGTNKLPGIVTAVRQTILEAGGEILFNTKLIDFNVEGGRLNNIILQDVLTGARLELKTDVMILA